jgi:alpha,alpha-trehalase
MNLETDQNTPDENLMECRHPIYCNTTYLIAFQLSNIFNDSKTFVDSPTKLPINQSIILLNQLLKIDSISFGSDKDAVVNYFKSSDIDFKKVYDEVFYYPGVDVLPTSMPTELAARPLAGIQSHYFQWAKFLDSTWAMLSRKVNISLISKGSGTSRSETLYPFIVPGGRFREFYYWDSYWVVKGLLVGQRFNMVENILKNFYDYVERHGYVPNGNRVYYSNRSQPPLLVQMVKDYFLASGDIKVLSYAIRKLEKEYLFWMTKRVANGLVEGDYPLNVYNVSNSAPRPESFVEDLAIASTLPDPADSVRFYKDVASGAETGWVSLLYS